MFLSKNVQAEKSYGKGFDMEKFAKETDIKNFVGYTWQQKLMHLKVLKIWLHRYNFHNKVPEQSVFVAQFRL